MWSADSHTHVAYCVLAFPFPSKLEMNIHSHILIDSLAVANHCQFWKYIRARCQGNHSSYVAIPILYLLIFNLFVMLRIKPMSWITSNFVKNLYCGFS